MRESGSDDLPKLLVVAVAIFGAASVAIGVYLEFWQTELLLGHPIFTNLVSGMIGFSVVTLIAGVGFAAVKSRITRRAFELPVIAQVEEHLAYLEFFQRDPGAHKPTVDADILKRLEKVLEKMDSLHSWATHEILGSAIRVAQPVHVYLARYLDSLSSTFDAGKWEHIEQQLRSVHEDMFESAARRRPVKPLGADHPYAPVPGAQDLARALTWDPDPALIDSCREVLARFHTALVEVVATLRNV
jgi:hypothetical protein